MHSGHFTRLSGDECRHLVRGHSVGRVCWLSESGLQVVPVTYLVSGEGIYLRVDPASVLGQLAAGVNVVFEVDDIDIPTATGWSVVVRGEATVTTEPDLPVLPNPWAPGSRGLAVVITPNSYAGRAVSRPVP